MKYGVAIFAVLALTMAASASSYWYFSTLGNPAQAYPAYSYARPYNYGAYYYNNYRPASYYNSYPAYNSYSYSTCTTTCCNCRTYQSYPSYNSYNYNPYSYNSYGYGPQWGSYTGYGPNGYGNPWYYS